MDTCGLINPFTIDPVKALHFAIQVYSPPLLISDIRALWSARAPECQKLTSIHRHQTPPRYRPQFMAVAAWVSRHLLASRPLRPNATSSTKLEVHNVAQCRRRTEPRPQGIRAQNVVPIGPAVAEIYSRTDRQTHRQTDGLITILRIPTKM